MTILSGDNVEYTTQYIFGSDATVIERNGLTANSTDTITDIENIVSEFQGGSNIDMTGQIVEFYIYNNSLFEITVTVGAGTIMSPGPTDILYPQTIKKYIVLIISNTTGTVFNLDWNGSKLVINDDLIVDGSIQANLFTDSTSILTNGIINTNTVNGIDFNDGTATLSSGILSGLVPPSQDSESANKGYVDSVASGITWLDVVRLSTTTNITLSGEQTIDDISSITGDKVLVKEQTNEVENGIYIVDSGAWTRSSDMSIGINASGLASFVEEGTIWNGIALICNSPPGSDVVDTDTLSFTQFTSAGIILAGSALSKTGNTLNVNYDNTTLSLSSNTLEVKDFGINSDKLALDSVVTTRIEDNAVTNSKIQNNSITLTAGDGLQNGGVVNLGSIVTIDVDTTVLRTTGNQISSGRHTFSNVTQSTSSTTGSVLIYGGLGITKNLYSSGRIETTDVIEAPIITDGTATLSSGILTGLEAPILDSDATNKAYVDSVVQGLEWKVPVKLSTIVAGVLATDFENGDTLDGMTLVTGDRILIKDQTNAVENGIYIVNGSGAPTRSTDMSSGSAENFSVLVENGTINNGTSWVVTGESPFIIGINELIWIQFAASGTINAGEALNKVGNTLHVNYDDITIGVTSNNLEIKNSAITTSKIATDAVTNDKLSTDAVTTDKIQNNSITSIKLANDSVTTDKIQNNSITSIKLANDAVTTDKIPNNAITTIKLANDAVTTDKLVNNAITTDKITNSSVTNSKLQYSSLTLTAGDGLKNAGLISLGGTTTIDVDSTVLRNSGNQTITGNMTVSNTITTQSKLIITDPGVGSNTVTIQAPTLSTGGYTLTLPTDDGINGQVLSTDGLGALSWDTIASSGIPDVFSEESDFLSTTTSKSYVEKVSLSFTSITGNYLIYYSAEVGSRGKNSKVGVRVEVDNVTKGL